MAKNSIYIITTKEIDGTRSSIQSKEIDISANVKMIIDAHTYWGHPVQSILIKPIIGEK